jgi:hypothetical protein
MNIMNVKVYGILESAIASGYPMSTSIKDDIDFNLMAWDMYENAVDENDKDVLQGAYDSVEASIKRLGKLGNTYTGSGHDCALKGATVQADLTCSQAMHMQILRYHFFDIVSSQSKMHRLLKMDIGKQCNEFVNEGVIECMETLIGDYNEAINDAAFDTEKSKEMYLGIIYSCPMGLELTFRFTTNYLQLKTIYNQRKYHKLPEWRIFCDWILSLPKFKELTGCGEGEE